RRPAARRRPLHRRRVARGPRGRAGGAPGHALPRMERLLFLTGRLAEPALRRVLSDIAPPGEDPPFAWEVREIGLQVAALMTADMIRRRVAAPVDADRVIVPGRCRGDLDQLAQ